MQKHQLQQQCIAHSCPVWSHEQPTVTKDSLHLCWISGRGWKYFLKQRVHCLVQGILCNFYVTFFHAFKNEKLHLFNSHKLFSRPRPRTFKTKIKTKTETLGIKTETKTKTLGLKTKTKTENWVSRPRLKSRALQVCCKVTLNFLWDNYIVCSIKHR